MSGAEELAEGMAEALAIAKGEQAAASVTIKGHKYVPATALTTAEARIQELEAALEKMRQNWMQSLDSQRCHCESPVIICDGRGCHCTRCGKPE